MILLEDADIQLCARRCADIALSADELRKAQSRAQHSPTAVEGGASGPRVECSPNESRQLGRLLDNGAEDRADIRRAVRTQPDQCRRRQALVGRVDDGATGNKRHLMGSCDFSCNVRLGVDSSSARLRMKRSLVRGISDRGIDANDVCVHSARKPFVKALCPCPVGGKPLLCPLDGSRGNPLASHQPGRQSSSNAKADNAGNAALDRGLEMSREVRPLTADDGYAGAEGYTSL